MATDSGFDPLTIPQYLWTGPIRILRTLEEQGPTAAARSARRYSMALCLGALVLYVLLACALGFFQVSLYTETGSLSLAARYALPGLIIVGLVDLEAIVTAVWSAALGVRALFRSEEPRGPALSAVMWGIALAIVYIGVFAGVLGAKA